MAAPPSARRRPRRETGFIPCDEDLFQHLRGVRKQIADARGVPAYVILGDATLRRMAAERPTSRAQMAAIPGWGERKLADFADAFAQAIASYSPPAV
jgi:ATP-dependent DNA helicase RecQ